MMPFLTVLLDLPITVLHYNTTQSYERIDIDERIHTNVW